MQNLTVDVSVWSELRFNELRRSMKWSKPEALGCLALFWGNTRGVYESASITEMQALDALTFCVKPKKALSALCASGYVTGANDALLVVDNQKFYDRAQKLRSWGQRGGFHAHKTKKTKARKDAPQRRALAVAKTTALVAADTQGPASRSAWDAYAQAYKLRYNVDPLRNAKVNAQMSYFVKQVGKDAAPAVAQFYLSHNGDIYVRAQHDVGSMLRDASGLHTQMLRNEEVNEQTVRMMSERKLFEAQLKSLNAAY